MLVLLGLLLAAGLIFTVVKMGGKIKLRIKKGFHKKIVPSPHQFRDRAARIGFTPQETTLLYELATAAKPENPLEALWQFQFLDMIIKSVIQQCRKTGKETDTESQKFLGKLLDYRKQLTIRKLNMRKKLSSSREIPAGQEVQAILADIGIFRTKVTAHSSYFALLSPIVHDLSPDFKWEQRKVMIFFRRRNDGEYSFNTTVIKEIEDGKSHEFVLLLHHQEILAHAQKRQSIRVVLNQEAHMYPVGDDAGRTFAESKSCRLYDISDEGCAVMVHGKMNAPRAVIIQVMLDNRLVGINGECLSMQYDKAKNMSMLHIRADSIPREVKNIILAVMFGLIDRDAGAPAPTAPHPADGNGRAEPAHQINTVTDADAGTREPAVVQPPEQSASSSDASSSDESGQNNAEADGLSEENFDGVTNEP